MVVTKVRITINKHSETIDGLVHRRKFLHMGMLELSRAQVDKVERELQPLALFLETIYESDADPESEVADLKGTETVCFKIGVSGAIPFSPTKSQRI
jgi:hypothetical protein